MTYWHMGVTGVSLGISGREDSVHQHKGAHNLSTQAIALGVAMGNGVSPPSVGLVEAGLEGFHDASPADGPQALANHVENGTRQGHLPRQEQAEGDGGIDVSSWTHSSNPGM